ncbi:MAG: NUDIX domain-containing protein [Eggerthellaceae bacterium]|jgi:8-oxo-dGTP pyrophosphatase MutT (NUDIX family)
MTTPQFIIDIRRKIGHDPLWLSGITAFVRDDDGRILLGRRADTGEWALVYGIIEPGEDPARACVREVLEETGVVVEPVWLVRVASSDQLVVYGNGDQCWFLDIMFWCRPRAGEPIEPRVNDDESVDVGWFDPSDLPEPLSSSTRERLRAVRAFAERHAAGNDAALFG